MKPTKEFEVRHYLSGEMHGTFSTHQVMSGPIISLWLIGCPQGFNASGGECL
ncbi:hypothetical protein BDV40DRAFT_276755 [Aspergillus tamarii]|uniref:Uncharacterized protein n=1 Tax=Aspergillus tamarii TaxID=41984 RepID=A0A5N6UHG5_ASPTM|nr:hypothetical protein BDV40DRAFT_276755 [Aspergillus tamarii]